MNTTLDVNRAAVDLRQGHMNPFIIPQSDVINNDWPRGASIDTHGARRAHLVRVFEEAASHAIM